MRRKHLYRDAAVFHGVLAAFIIVAALAVGSDVAKGSAVAAAYFVAATAWSWWRFRQRDRAAVGPK
jgi:membrane protein implicated in regulation of membrane protease activity